MKIGRAYGSETDRAHDEISVRACPWPPGAPVGTPPRRTCEAGRTSRPTELSGVIETESGDPNDFLNLTRRSLRTKLRVTRTILEPVIFYGLIPLQPLVEPFAGMVPEQRKWKRRDG